MTRTKLDCLLDLFADEIVTVPTSKTIVSTKLETVLCNDPSIDISHLMPCTQEEADTRLDCSYTSVIFLTRHKGYNKVCIITVDTDVVIIALYAFQFLEIQELCVEFGAGVKKSGFQFMS